jgi:hypothetical protein
MSLSLLKKGCVSYLNTRQRCEQWVCMSVLSMRIHLIGPLAGTLRNIDKVRVIGMWADFKWFSAVSDSVLFVVPVNWCSRRMYCCFPRVVKPHPKLTALIAEGVSKRTLITNRAKRMVMQPASSNDFTRILSVPVPTLLKHVTYFEKMTYCSV